MHTFQMTEGQQGLNRYFTGNIPVGQLEHMVRFADEMPELDEDKQMQRGLAKGRIKELVSYLLEAPDHFFSAVTLVILPRDLDRSAEEIDSDSGEGDFDFEEIEWNRPGRNRFGILYLSGDVILFPGDGQHRLKAEFEALQENPDLAREELPVVMIPFVSTDRVRQLFSDLNLNAKPISKSVGFHYETRHPEVVVAKDAADLVPLFDGRINKIRNSLSAKSNHVVTLGTLVPASKSIAEGLAELDGLELVDYFKESEKATAEIAEVWKGIIEAFEPRWAEAVEDEGGMTPGALREKFVFPHGLGWRGLALAAGQLIVKEGRSNWQAVFSRAVKSLDWRREAPIWEGNAVIHDPQDPRKNRVNNTGPAVRDLANIVLKEAGTALV